MYSECPNTFCLVEYLYEQYYYSCLFQDIAKFRSYICMCCLPDQDPDIPCLSQSFRDKGARTKVTISASVTTFCLLIAMLAVEGISNFNILHKYLRHCIYLICSSINKRKQDLIFIVMFRSWYITCILDMVHISSNTTL